MKRHINSLIVVLLSLLTLGFSLTGFTDEYDDALYELNRGQFLKAKALLEPLAAENFAPAQYQLAMIYKNGYGVHKDITQTVKYLNLAAKNNYPDALFDLAVLYTDGEGVKKDLKKAFELTQKAAKKGLASAQYNLGVMYYQGQGTRRDYLQAARWYQKAADQNYALAQFNLALMYYEGQGVEKSTEMSYVWNSIAAKNGYPRAKQSRDMDAHNLTVEQIEIANEKVNHMYRKIQSQAELRAKLARQESFY